MQNQRTYLLRIFMIFIAAYWNYTRYGGWPTTFRRCPSGIFVKIELFMVRPEFF